MGSGVFSQRNSRSSTEGVSAILAAAASALAALVLHPAVRFGRRKRHVMIVLDRRRGCVTAMRVPHGIAVFSRPQLCRSPFTRVHCKPRGLNRNQAIAGAHGVRNRDDLVGVMLALSLARTRVS